MGDYFTGFNAYVLLRDLPKRVADQICTNCKYQGSKPLSQLYINCHECSLSIGVNNPPTNYIHKPKETA